MGLGTTARRVLILTLLMLGGAIAASGGTVEVAASPTLSSTTQIRIFQPFTVSGRLTPGLQVQKTVTGSCWEGSIVDGVSRDAWRCLAGNFIYDPCFEQPPARHTRQHPPTGPTRLLACSAAPWLRYVTMLRLSRLLPYGQANRGSPPYGAPWALVLRNGGRCVLLGGATGTIAGMGVSYGCSNGTGLNEVHRNKQPWTIFFVKPGSKTPRQVSVAVAWY